MQADNFYPDQADPEKLEMRRVEALERDDAEDYFRLCEETGVEPEDTYLYERGQADILMQEGLQEKLEAEQPQKDAARRSRTRREGTPYLWGIRKKDLKLLDYGTLGTLLRGMHNLEQPTAMMDAQNPDEILAKWYGAGQLKKIRAHRTDRLGDHEKLYKTLDSLAYPRPDFSRMAAQCRRRYSPSKGQQQERFTSLDETTRQAFVQAFASEPRPSMAEEPDNPSSYYTPNIDGESKGAYVTAIYALLKSKWEKADAKNS